MSEPSYRVFKSISQTLRDSNEERIVKLFSTEDSIMSVIDETNATIEQLLQFIEEELFLETMTNHIKMKSQETNTPENSNQQEIFNLNDEITLTER